MLAFISLLLPLASAASFCDVALSHLQPDGQFVAPRIKFERSFPDRHRLFQVGEYNLEHRPGERNRDRILRLVYRLIDTARDRVVWAFTEFPNHGALAAILDPEDDDAVFLAKKVERLYLDEDRRPGARPHRAYPGLSSDFGFEVFRVRAERGRVVWMMIYDTELPVTDLAIDHRTLTVTTPADAWMIPF